MALYISAYQAALGYPLCSGSQLRSNLVTDFFTRWSSIYLVWGNPRQAGQWVDKVLWRRMWGIGGWKAQLEPQSALAAQKGNHILICFKRSASCRSEEVMDPTWGLQHEATDPLEWEQRRAMKMIGGTQHLSYEVKAVKVWVFSLEKAPGRLYSGLPVLKGSVKMGKDSIRECSDRIRGNGFAPQKGGLGIHIQNKLFTQGGEAQWSCGCPISVSVQGQVGWPLEQPGVEEGTPGRGRRLERDGL